MTDETRQRVISVAKEMNYRPNRMASSLRRAKSHTIGFVDDTVATTPFAVRMLKGAQDAAVTRAYSMIVASSASNPELEAQEIALLRSFPVDGVVIGRMYHQYVDVDAVAVGMPVVLVNARARNDDVTAIVPDEERIGADATRELLKRRTSSRRSPLHHGSRVRARGANCRIPQRHRGRRRGAPPVRERSDHGGLA